MSDIITVIDYELRRRGVTPNYGRIRDHVSIWSELHAPTLLTVMIRFRQPKYANNHAMEVAAVSVSGQTVTVMVQRMPMELAEYRYDLAEESCIDQVVDRVLVECNRKEFWGREYYRVEKWLSTTTL